MLQSLVVNNGGGCLLFGGSIRYPPLAMKCVVSAFRKICSNRGKFWKLQSFQLGIERPPTVLIGPINRWSRIEKKF